MVMSPGLMLFFLTPEEARVDDLAKACVEIKFILFIEKTDPVSYIHSKNRMRNIRTVTVMVVFPYQFHSVILHNFTKLDIMKFVAGNLCHLRRKKKTCK